MQTDAGGSFYRCGVLGQFLLPDHVSRPSYWNHQLCRPSKRVPWLSYLAKVLWLSSLLEDVWSKLEAKKWWSRAKSKGFRRGLWRVIGQTKATDVHLFMHAVWCCCTQSWDFKVCTQTTRENQTNSAYLPWTTKGLRFQHSASIIWAQFQHRGLCRSQFESITVIGGLGHVGAVWLQHPPVGRLLDGVRLCVSWTIAVRSIPHRGFWLTARAGWWPQRIFAGREKNQWINAQYRRQATWGVGMHQQLL